MVLSRKQVLVLAGVVVLLIAVSVGYQYHGRWHGSRPQQQGQAIPQAQGQATPPFQGISILDPPLQDLLLPVDTVIEKKMTQPGGHWVVKFETGVDWDTLYNAVDSYLRSKGCEPDPLSAGNSPGSARRWDSPDRRFFVMFMRTFREIMKPDEVPKVYEYGIMVFFESPVKPKLPSPEGQEP